MAADSPWAEGEASLENLLRDVDLSSTSTTKYDRLSEALVEALGVARGAIYVSTVAKDFQVRFEQSRKAREAQIGVAVLTDHRFLERSLSPARHLIAEKTKDAVLFFGRDEKGRWKIQKALERSGFELHRRLPGVDPAAVELVVPERGLAVGAAYFDEETFRLLAELKAHPTLDFYLPKRQEFQERVINPFQEVVLDLIERLPQEIRSRMETGSKLFSRLVKNDYGKGGVWDFYWGAIYPPEAARIEGPQLYFWMNADRLDVGFHIGEYGPEYRARFVENLAKHGKELLRLLTEALDDPRMEFGRRVDSIDGRGETGGRALTDLREWIPQAAEVGIDAAVAFPRDQVLSMGRSALVEEGRRLFSMLFPLVLIALSDDPVQEVAAYLAEGYELPPAKQPTFTLEECAADLGIDSSEIARWVRAIHRHGQAILYGPPGTGKTWAAEAVARHLVSDDDGFTEVVQFHPAYAYEDFVQGLRPRAIEGGGLDYPLVEGRFPDFCRRASARDGTCVLIIDEINRANLSRVFGELMYLLEYRDREIPLAAGGSFKIPANIRIIGTMNTADRSIALVDHALRRRFAFWALRPNYVLLERFHSGSTFPIEKLIDMLKALNAAIDDSHYEIGITFFLRTPLEEHLQDVWETQIEPYLEEYFFDQPTKVDAFRWKKISGKLK